MIDWTPIERDLISQIFPRKGVRGCLAVMPNRKHWAIEQQAKRMGLEKPKPPITEPLFIPNTQPKPLSDLDRLALREWGRAANGPVQLVPTITPRMAA